MKIGRGRLFRLKNYKIARLLVSFLLPSSFYPEIDISTHTLPVLLLTVIFLTLHLRYLFQLHSSLLSFIIFFFINLYVNFNLSNLFRKFNLRFSKNKNELLHFKHILLWKKMQHFYFYLYLYISSSCNFTFSYFLIFFSFRLCVITFSSSFSILYTSLFTRFVFVFIQLPTAEA